MRIVLEVTSDSQERSMRIVLEVTLESQERASRTKAMANESY